MKKKSKLCMEPDWCDKLNYYLIIPTIAVLNFYICEWVKNVMWGNFTEKQSKGLFLLDHVVIPFEKCTSIFTLNGVGGPSV